MHSAFCPINQNLNKRKLSFHVASEHFFDKDLNSVPDGHERETHEETKGATYVRNQWDEGVDQNL